MYVYSYCASSLRILCRDIFQRSFFYLFYKIFYKAKFRAMKNSQRKVRFIIFESAYIYVAIINFKLKKYIKVPIKNFFYRIN